MIFLETKLKGAFIVELERKEDERGFFARAFCAQEFQQHGMESKVLQANLAYNAKKGTVRGMHFQVAPAIEPKFIRCISGSVWDVIVDMRPGSQTFLQHIGVELSAENRRALFVPDSFAHGYQTLTDDAELLYLVGEYYTPGCESGVRYNDPAIKIDWPLDVTLVSEKDKNWPLINAPKHA